MHKKLVTIFIILASVSIRFGVSAQSLDSSNYTLQAPNIGALGGIIESTNYSQIIDTDMIDGFTSDSSTYAYQNSFISQVMPGVPGIECFETTTNSGSTSCVNLPGSNGMQAICGTDGCYDRAKIEIDAGSNSADTRYAVQISTDATFATNVFYVDGTTRLLKSSLTLSDFIPKCEWDGTTSSGVCASANTTYQRTNILGLAENTQYYVRAAALTGTDNANFSQTAWGPSSNTTTSTPNIVLDFDVAANTSTETSGPYIVNFGTLAIGNVNTASNMLVMNLDSNAINGVEVNASSLNGGLYNTSAANLVPQYNGDLAAATSGFGLRNDSANTSAEDTGTLGNIIVASTPSDFTDTGNVHKVGGIGTSSVPLFSTNNRPIKNAIIPFELKAKVSLQDDSGSYSETIFYTVKSSF